MGTNTLVDKAGGQVVTPSVVNDIHTALAGDFVGRSASNVAESGKRLGTPVFPWGQMHVDTLFIEGSEFDPASVSVLPNQVKSGKIRSTSNQPSYLTPAGPAGGATCTLDATPTPLVFDVDNSEVTVSSDLSFTLLDTAPNTNNTALVNDADATDGEETRVWGEYNFRREKSQIDIDTVGTEISTRVGEWAAFSINDGANDEFFFAYIETATRLSQIYRGYFYDDTLAPVNRIPFANNDTITYLKANFLFVENNASTIDFTSNPLIWNATEPSGPADGDYWYDLTADIWKRFNSGLGSYESINRTLVGIAVCDDTDCLVARSMDFQAARLDLLDIELQEESNSVIISRNTNSVIHVEGNEILKRWDTFRWDITTDLATAADMYDATEQADRDYWLYVKDTGEEVISDIHPYARPDLRGWYHPHNPWRCVGYVSNIGVNFNLPLAFLKSGLDLELGVMMGGALDITFSTLLSDLTNGHKWNLVNLPLVDIIGTTPLNSVDASDDSFKFNRIGYWRIDSPIGFRSDTGTGLEQAQSWLHNETLDVEVTNRAAHTMVFDAVDIHHHANLVLFFQITRATFEDTFALRTGISTNNITDAFLTLQKPHFRWLGFNPRDF